MTAFPSLQMEFDALRLGADMVVSKPIALVALNDAVNGDRPKTSGSEYRSS